MNAKQQTKISKRLSLILRHNPQSIGIQLDSSGWANKLYHGTPEKFLTSIFKQGLQKQQRHHVHMSEDIPLMLEVAKRRGVPSLLEINAGEMVKQGHHFFHTDNDVWLTDNIPPEFITRINTPSTK